MINLKVEQLSDLSYRYKYSLKVPLDIASQIGVNFISVYLGVSLPTSIKECEFLAETHSNAFKILRSKGATEESKDFAIALLKSASKQL